MTFSFNLDEQIFLKNDKTNKVYTLTLNKDKQYNVTREWTIPNQTSLAIKTDSFALFKQAAEFMENHYNERIEHGYVEVMRRQGVIKKSTLVEKHKVTEVVKQRDPVYENSVTGQAPGKRIEDLIKSRHQTTIADRMNFGNKNK